MQLGEAEGSAVAADHCELVVTALGRAQRQRLGVECGVEDAVGGEALQGAAAIARGGGRHGDLVDPGLLGQRGGAHGGGDQGGRERRLRQAQTHRQARLEGSDRERQGLAGGSMLEGEHALRRPVELEQGVGQLADARLEQRAVEHPPERTAARPEGGGGLRRVHAGREGTR